MSFELTGKLTKIYDTEQIKETFRKREFVVEKSDGQYPDFIKFQLVQDRTSVIDDFQEGQEVKVSFDLRGREWQGKYFTNLQAWRVEAAGGDAPGGNSASGSDTPVFNDEPKAFESGNSNDDLPF